MENEKEHVLIYGTSKSMDETVFQWREGLSIRVFFLAELFQSRSMEKENKHVLIYGTSKSMDVNKLIAEQL
jgi:hypothetical protein